MALQRAGIAFEIVPGVTTAIAAPALAGIPVTHRGLSPGFVVLTGSDPDAVDRVVSSIAPGALTIVVLMGIGARAQIAKLLIERGWNSETPAAIVLGAATPEMWTWRGALSDLLSVDLPPTSAAGTLVIGGVAGLQLLKGLEHVYA